MLPILEITLNWMLLDLTDKSTLVQVMACGPMLTHNSCHHMASLGHNGLTKKSPQVTRFSVLTLSENASFQEGNFLIECILTDYIFCRIFGVRLTLTCKDQIIPVKLGQYNGCRCTGSECRHVISNHCMDKVTWFSMEATYMNMSHQNGNTANCERNIRSWSMVFNSWPLDVIIFFVFYEINSMQQGLTSKQSTMISWLCVHTSISVMHVLLHVLWIIHRCVFHWICDINLSFITNDFRFNEMKMNFKLTLWCMQ